MVLSRGWSTEEKGPAISTSGVTQGLMPREGATITVEIMHARQNCSRPHSH